MTVDNFVRAGVWEVDMACIGDWSCAALNSRAWPARRGRSAAGPARSAHPGRVHAFNQVTLTQRNTDGDPVATVVLEGGVRVESWQLSSSTGEAAPTESLSFAAQKFCVTDVPSGNKFCYDFALAKVI